LPAAQRRARAAGFEGAKYPWEADPENGTEQVLYAAHRLSVGEIHVNADIAIAQWQYWLVTHDLEWLRKDGWPVIRNLAEFWASRATYDKTKRRYEIRDVVSVMEPYAHVDDDTFTNAAAAKVLRIAVDAAKRVGAKADPRWSKIAAGLLIPFSDADQRHLDFGAGAPPPLNDHDLAFLAFPSLDMRMSETVRRNDYRLAASSLSADSNPPNSMGLAPLTIAAAALGNSTDAAQWLQDNMAAATLKSPFNVRTETPDNNTGYFLTGSAGFVQSLVYGLTGLRVGPSGLVQAYPPVLPAGWKSLTLKNVSFRGQHYDIAVDRGVDGKPRLRRQPR
jgi:trehalose/maltose hydrolase-like predicted phosphorylase